MTIYFLIIVYLTPLSSPPLLVYTLPCVCFKKKRIAIRHLQEWSSRPNMEKINMFVFLKMRQISDVEIDDGIYRDPYSVFTIFSKNPVWAINHKCNSQKVFINKYKSTFTKRWEIIHSHQGEKSNYNQKLEIIQL